jgi:branched-chain amino acid transport system ATP-binding protein
MFLLMSLQKACLCGNLSLLLEERSRVFLAVTKVTKSFGGLMALHGLDAVVHEGEIVGLMGPNGSGKTTLFSVITGFLKPESGEVKFRGVDITGLKPHKVCERGVMRTFQLVKPFTNMTAVRNVMVGRVYGRNPARSLMQAEEQSREILDFVGLGDKCDSIAGTLTLPERKRLEVARALSGKPYLLLLDEIMAGLNPVEVESAARLVTSIRDSGITVFMVEHLVKVLLGISDRVIVINAGIKISEGKPGEIVRDKQVIEAYLGRKRHA